MAYVKSEIVQTLLFMVGLLSIVSISGGTSVGSPTEPGFVGTLKNATVPEGRDAVLSCSVKNLDGHKVAWIHYDKSAILTVQTTVITRNPRISVTHEGQKTWNLHIHNVQIADEGAYMCQINTPKAKTRLSYLNVVVPPRIEDNLSSGDQVKTEGSNVTLECYATGSPTPTVSWKREDGQFITIDKPYNYSAPVVDGPILRLYKVSRLDMGAYMCIASNGIPPAVSKRIQLGIDFPPMMWVPAQQMNVLVGSEIKLTCHVEAHPEALTFWEHNGMILQPNSRITIRNVMGSPKYKVCMELHISKVQPIDHGNFKCVAKNPRGQTDGDISLTVEVPSTTTTQSTTTSTVVVEIVPKSSDRYQANEPVGEGYNSSFSGLEGVKDDQDTNRNNIDQKISKKPVSEKKRKNRDKLSQSDSIFESDSFFGFNSSSSSRSFSSSHIWLIHIYIYPALLVRLL